MEVSLPLRGFDDLDRNPAQCDDGFDCAGCPAEFKSATCSLAWHCLCALDEPLRWSMLKQPLLQGDDIDSFFRLDADSGDVDGVDELRCRAVVDLDDGEATTDAWINTQNSSHGCLLAMRSIALPMGEA